MRNHPTFSGISIVIPYYNEDAIISECLKAIAASWAKLSPSQKNAFEVILVDDCSPTPYREGNQKQQFDFKVFRMKKNGGAGVARNEGAHLARFSHVLFLDADVLLVPSTLKYAFERLVKNPDIKVLQGYYDKTPANKNPELFQYYMAFTWYYNCVITTDHGTGCILRSGCVIFNKAYFKQIGGFLNCYPKSGGEEHEIVSRIGAGMIIQDRRFLARHYYDGIPERIRKVFRRGMHYMDTIGKNDHFPLWFKIISGIRVISALTMTACLFMIFFNIIYTAAAYLSVAILYAIMDRKMMFFMIKNKSLVLAAVSIIFMQMEYTAISLGMLFNMLGFKNTYAAQRL